MPTWNCICIYFLHLAPITDCLWVLNAAEHICIVEMSTGVLDGELGSQPPARSLNQGQTEILIKSSFERYVYAYGSCSAVVAPELAFSWGICGWFSVFLCCRKNHVSKKGISSRRVQWSSQAGLDMRRCHLSSSVWLKANKNPCSPCSNILLHLSGLSSYSNPAMKKKSV